MTETAIVGAGVAGIACARRLHAAGHCVTLFDKGRGVGGRMATRRIETGSSVAQFDHGAQYFTARDPDFRAALDIFAPALAAWPTDLASLTQGRSTPAAPEPRFIGAPSMTALPKALALGLDVRLSTRIDALLRDAQGWTLRTEMQESLGPFESVIIATPAEQATVLVASHSANFASQTAAAETAPCWAGLFAYKTPTATPFTALRLTDHPILAWIGCDSAKPGRSGDLVCWVAHARSDWSTAHLERAPEEIAPMLQQALEAFFDNRPAPIIAQAHRWRYAQVVRLADDPFAWDGDLKLGMCGDWRIGPRVEAAWLSGHRLAGAMNA
jgi:predicted NAD/FAD-dependent oxidoreductase